MRQELFSALGKYFTYSCQAGSTTLPILQIRKLRDKEIKWFSQDPTSRRWQKWDWYPVSDSGVHNLHHAAASKSHQPKLVPALPLNLFCVLHMAFLSSSQILVDKKRSNVHIVSYLIESILLRFLFRKSTYIFAVCPEIGKINKDQKLGESRSWEKAGAETHLPRRTWPS